MGISSQIMWDVLEGGKLHVLTSDELADFHEEFAIEVSPAIDSIRTRQVFDSAAAKNQMLD